MGSGLGLNQPFQASGVDDQGPEPGRHLGEACLRMCDVFGHPYQVGGE